MNRESQTEWLTEIGTPEHYEFEPSCRLLKQYDEPEFDGELWSQANGPGTFQRVLKVFPKKCSGRVPAVAVPFYFPEAMLGYEPETGEKLPSYAGIEMMLHLVRRGFAAASADSYHLTYTPSTRDRGDFQRWSDASAVLLRDQPGWTGIGKLVFDTKLLVDSLESDARVDSGRIGIAGHSLGGKMAFYAGCLDPRIRAILASDFGFLWEQSNWNDPWYWGVKLDLLKAKGMTHAGLLDSAAPKPFFLIAGEFDDNRSFELMKTAEGYRNHPERLGFLNHASGHRPPPDALEAGYQFLERQL